MCVHGTLLWSDFATTVYSLLINSDAGTCYCTHSIGLVSDLLDSINLRCIYIYLT